MSNLAFRSQTSGNDSSFSASSINATLPAGTQPGDLQIIWISAGLIPPTAAPTIVTPSGWTLAGSAAETIAGGGVNIRIHLFYKIAGPSEGTVNLAISGGANGAFGWGRLSYQNPDPTTQVAQVTFGQNTTASTSAVMTPGLTTGAANALLLTFLTQGVAQNATPPGSMTERIDNAAGGFEIAEELQAVAGASGSRTFTLPSAADYAWGFAELRSNNAITKVYPLFGIGGSFGAGPFGELVQPNSTIYSVSAASSIATGGTATSQAVMAAAAAQSIVTTATSTATGVFGVAATQSITTGATAAAVLQLVTAAASAITVNGTALSASAVASAASSSIATGATAVAALVASVSAASAITTGGAATAQAVGAAAAASSAATGATATAQLTGSVAAASAIAVGSTATSLAAGGQDAQASITTGSSASTQAVGSAAAASSISTTATATAQQTDAASAASAITVGGTATIPGGAVYDVSAAEAVHTGDTAAGPGLLHVSAADTVDVSDAATAVASGSTAELEAEILRLRTLLAMASGGADDSANDTSHDQQQRDMLQHREVLEAVAESKRARIARQNDLIIKFATATVLHEEEPAS